MQVQTEALNPQQQQLEQQLLFGDDEGADLLTVEDDAKRGAYSGSRIEKNRRKVEAIVAALVDGFGVDRIAAAYSVSVHTVLAIRDRHPELIAVEERQLSALLGKVQTLGWQQYLEAIIDKRIAPAQLPVGLGIAGDKKALLDGKPTAIVQHRESITLEAVNRLVDALPVIDVQALPADCESSEKP